MSQYATTRLSALAVRALAAMTLVVSTASASGAQEPATSPAGVREGTYLYRFAMLQAAPGRLVDLIDAVKQQAPVLVAAGDELPVVVRHSQGDHWDLLVIYPMESVAAYFAPDRVAKRTAQAGPSLRPLLSWHEDLLVKGPPVAVLREHVRGMGLLHFEMMQALPGKFDALVEERRMENAFNRERGRGQTLIFTHELGSAWDVVTLGVYRDWRQYSETDGIPAAVQERAARKAGFPSADGVGPYMRTLISTHRDTLGPPVQVAAR